MLAQFHASWGFPVWTKLRDRLRGWASKHMVPGNWMVRAICQFL